MALFGQGVAEMFKDVVPQASASDRFGSNAIDWAQVKPFQVIKPMSSWAATKTGATAPTPPTAPQAATPQSDYQKWLAQQSGIKTGDGSRDVDRTSGPYGNGTNLSDKEWQEVKDARDYAKGLAPVDKVGLGALGQFILSPWGTIAKIPELQKQMAAAQEETSLFAQMYAADKAAAEIAARQKEEQANSMLPGMAVAGANTVANPMALDPMQALQQQLEQQQATNDYFSSIGVPITSAQSMTSQAEMDAINAELAAIASGSTSTGYQSAPAEPTATLSPSQTQAMVDSLTSAGYYTGSDGYNAAGDTSPTGYAADGMGPPSSAASDTSSGSDTSGGGGKIVCTAMNQAYGFGSYRNAIWLKYSADSLTKAHEVGYHAIFQPLVSYAYNGSSVAKTIVKKTLENIARHRTSDIRAEMRNGKRDIIGRCYRFVLEPLCYVVGKLKGY